MIEWIKCSDRLPRTMTLVWIYWRDREVLLGCKTAEDCEPQDCWYSMEDEKCRWTNWWMPIIDPTDKPLPPYIND